MNEEKFNPAVANSHNSESDGAADGYRGRNVGRVLLRPRSLSPRATVAEGG
jgi:hypothetical protein